MAPKALKQKLSPMFKEGGGGSLGGGGGLGAGGLAQGLGI